MLTAGACRWPLLAAALPPLWAASCSYRVETPARVKVGTPGDYRPGRVETRYQAAYGLWVVHDGGRLVALRAACPQEGCRPNWLEGGRKFKCPCCGSAFRQDGTQVGGPAPRSLERLAIAVAGDGRLEVDTGRAFRKEAGQWDDPASYVPAGGKAVPDKEPAD
jgi:cytochrome b6-f complex iron-sulfur subunit